MRYILLLAVLLLSSFPALAQLKDENLLQGLPDKYELGFQDKQGPMVMQEYVARGETVSDWTQMVTTQIFLGGVTVGPQQFLQAVQQQWLQQCPGTKTEPVIAGKENGYSAATTSLRCPKNPATNQPEFTWFKAIQGKDSFYLVQKAFKFAPSDDQVKDAVNYLRAVTACDTRGHDHPCPQLDKVKRKSSH